MDSKKKFANAINYFHSSFNTNAQIKSIIGKDLINDDNIAILELVKNSYDAEASEISIVFKNLCDNDDIKIIEPTSLTSRVIISDNGCGMDRDDIIHKWLNIAWSEKSKDINEKRFYAGSKGVGRFSCDRLGEYLTLITRINKEKHKEKNKKAIRTEDQACHDNLFYVLNINWRDFEENISQDMTIQSIPIVIYSYDEIGFAKDYPEFSDFKYGTILDIQKLRYRWTNRKRDLSWSRERLLKLRKYLERFINPNQQYVDSSFRLLLSASEFDDSNLNKHQQIGGKIENRIFDQLMFRTTYIVSEISEDGVTIKTELYHRGNRIFKLEELNPYGKLRNIKIFLHYMNTYSKIYFSRFSGTRVVDFGSIFLFLNGFRIPPYGESGNDWLGLEERKAQGYNRYLGSREIIGRVEIVDRNNSFVVISNREGIAKNDAFQQLVFDFESNEKNRKYNGFYYRVHRILEKFVVIGLDWDRAVKEEIEEDEIDFDNNKIDDLYSLEQYQEDNIVKDKRILTKLLAIIRPNKDYLLNLDVDDSILKSVIEDEEEKASEQYKILLDKLGKLSNKDGQVKVSASTIKLLHEYKNQAEDILKQKQRAEKERDAEKKKREDVERLHADERRRREFAEREREQEKRKREKAEKEKDEYESKYKESKRENSYLIARDIFSKDDIDGLIHHINMGSADIKYAVENLIYCIESGECNKDEVISTLKRVKMLNEKSAKLASLMTKAKFAKQDEEYIDISRFIYEYLSDLDNIHTFRLNIRVPEPEFEWKMRCNKLDIAIIIDNLISNAKKASSQEIIFLMHIDAENNSLVIDIIDDGNGLDTRFKDNISSIFNLGVTTTNGSGIGLNYISRVLGDYNASIAYIGVGFNDIGSNFRIIFRK